MKVRPISDPDRSIDLQYGIDGIMAHATAKLNSAGFSTSEVLTAWDETLNTRWKILE
jgi:hypothetical protein